MMFYAYGLQFYNYNLIGPNESKKLGNFLLYLNTKIILGNKSILPTLKY